MKIVLWRLGSLEHKILPTEAACQKLVDTLKETRGQDIDVLDLIWGPDIEVQVVDLPDLESITHIITKEKDPDGPVQVILDGKLIVDEIKGKLSAELTKTIDSTWSAAQIMTQARLDLERVVNLPKDEPIYFDNNALLRHRLSFYASTTLLGNGGGANVEYEFANLPDDYYGYFNGRKT